MAQTNLPLLRSRALQASGGNKRRLSEAKGPSVKKIA